MLAQLLVFAAMLVASGFLFGPGVQLAKKVIK